MLTLTLFAMTIAGAAPHGGSPSIYGPPAPPPPVLGPSTPTAGATQAAGVAVAEAVAQVRSDIDDGRSSGQLSRKQAKELRVELGEINQLEERFARDGISDDERAELQNRVEVIRAIANAKRLGTIK